MRLIAINCAAPVRFVIENSTASKGVSPEDSARIPKATDVVKYPINIGTALPAPSIKPPDKFLLSGFIKLSLCTIFNYSYPDVKVTIFQINLLFQYKVKAWDDIFSGKII